MDQHFNQMVAEWVDAHKAEMQQTLSEFVQIPSVLDPSTAGEGKPYGQACRDMLEALQKKAEAFGLNCFDVDGHALEIRNRAADDAEIGIFNHGDVVAVNGDWVFPPFCGRIDGDWVLGRGSHDNKCGVVMSLYLLRMVRELNIELKHGLRLVVGFKEETGMQDMKYYVAHRKMPLTSLVADCTFPVNFGQKGGVLGSLRVSLGEEILSLQAGVKGAASVPDHAEAVVDFPFETVSPLAEGLEDVTVEKDGEHTRIVAVGIATHTANPWLGKSAFYALSRLLIRLPFTDEKTRRAMEAIHAYTSDYYGAPLALDGEDDTGKNTIVMSYAYMEGRKLVMRIVNKACLSYPIETFAGKLKEWCAANGFEFDEKSEIRRHVSFDRQDPRVKVLQDVYQQMTGSDAPPYCMGGSTYSKELPETITFGIIEAFDRPAYIPAGTGDCHSPNEVIDMKIPVRGLKIYAAAIKELDGIL